MPRVSKGPRYYRSKSVWVANLDGKPYILARGPKKETEQEAKEKYDDLVAARRVETDGDRGPVWAVLNAWLNWLQTRVDPQPVAPNTYAMNKRYIDSFCAMFGDVPSRDIRPHHFDEWLRAMMDPARVQKNNGRKLSWGAGGRRKAMDKMRAAFAWASTVGGLIKVNPFQVPGAEKLRPKRVNHRGKKVPIEDEEHRLLVEHALGRRHKDFAYLLMFLYGTGARPAEMHQAKAKEWDEDRKAFVIQPTEENVGRYKLARLGKERTVYVPEYLVPLARALMAKYPEGPIFLNERGRPWTVKSICRRFDSHAKVINESTGREAVREAVTAYSERHGYVTRWMQTPGADVKTLAVLLNTSVTVIEKHYSWLFTKHDTLRDAMHSFEAAQREQRRRSGRTASPSSAEAASLAPEGPPAQA
jgi:integrase